MSKNETDILIDKFFKTAADRSRQADQHQAEIKKDSQQIASGVQKIAATQVEIQKGTRQTVEKQTEIQQNVQRITQAQTETKKQITTIAEKQKDIKQDIGNITQQQKTIQANSNKTLTNQENIREKLGNLSADVRDVKGTIPDIKQCKSMLHQLATYPPFPYLGVRLASQWQCALLKVKDKHIDQAIVRQQQIIKSSWPMPCGDWLPCLGLVIPRRTNARAEIKKLTQEKIDNLDTFEQCVAHFGPTNI